MAPDPHGVSTDDLRYLLAVARTGRLVSAATLLGVDHTTVRRRLDRLEAALGVRLLDRGADGWELTAIGRDVAARAAPLEHLVDDVLGAASGGPEALRGTVRLVAPEAFGTLFVVPALARVQAEHPGITVELVTSTRPLSLRGSGFDLAVTVGSATSSRLASETLAPYSVRLYAAREYVAKHPPITTLADLERHPLIFYVDALLTVRELDLAPVLGGMHVRFGSTNAFAQLAATREGAGIGLLHAFMADREPDLVPVLANEVDFRVQFSLSVRRDALTVDAVRLVRDALLEEVAARAHELVPQ
ncbi:DNA-binding transcriptional LysR family regulator [Microbacteriaceae bacterium SG_E_30_P1]|uniref:DNA-binding transcriptional LysR family regulator n=1 Tax=Antiquaquibacter oligotrophicus TaxID=2880260 RepID=A0ABT6KMF5_9MICO|nr:LysR family transcriptional regulator [Antiquaquibacter oligotrophicus]MDH6180354.1 DNA-binding transcriptional LysR family regulator [Antiquaquibacter oligotrophicus]UDF13904.1 LysR family transcriptional regulator [Antiquaquibacter oligotrophicus]